MADKPSRALVIYGDGLASSVSCSHSNLHYLASLASCGFLSLRDSPSPPNHEVASDREIREMSQLLDAYDYYISMNKKDGESGGDDELLRPNISERFMGLRAAIVTECSSVQSFTSKLGFTVLGLNDLCKQTDSSLQDSSDDGSVPSEIMRLLGFLGGDVQEKGEFDLVFLHIANTENPKYQTLKTSNGTNADWLDSLVGRIMQTVQPGSSIASRLHFSVVLSYETISEGEENCSLSLNTSKETNSDIYLLRPRQSYTMRGGRILGDVRHHHPMLVAQWQEGVTRKDLAETFSFKEFKQNGGNLAILADRFLHEVAFKLWKAPKYGA